MKPLRFSTIGLAACLLLPMAASGQERALYRLAPGDVLQLGVFGIPDFGRRVTVNVDGDISVPFLGEVRVEGLTIRDVRLALEKGLEEDGRIQSADVTVEMLEHRPFYINGDVSRPGAVPYRPGLTVRHAIALAGGYDALRFRTENPLMTAPDLKSENEGLWIDLARQQARIISLKAELDNKSDLDLSSIYSAPIRRQTLDELASFEENDFRIRLRNHEAQRAFLQQALENSETNLAALEETQSRDSESLKLQQEALDRMTASAAKGVVSTARVDDERRALSEIRARQSESTSRIVQARRERDDTARNLEQLDEQRRMLLNDTLREATIETEKLASRLQASGEKLLYTGAVKSQLRNADGGPELVIHRRTAAGQNVRIAAREDTEIQPDDVLEVSIRPEQLVASPNSQ